MKNSYLLVSTTNNEMIKKAKKLLENCFKTINLKIKNPHVSTFLFHKNFVDDVFYHQYLNYKSNKITKKLAIEYLNNIQSNEWLNHHELHSFGINYDDKITLNSDPLGVFTQFYYQNNDTVMFSDNIFLIANIIEAEISLDSFFDSLLFKKPFGEKTWFKDIFCLKAGEVLTYSKTQNTFSIAGGTSWNSLFNNSKKNYSQAFSSFFENINQQQPISLSLSAGSDSRSVLAGLLGKKLNLHCYSWGGKNYLETKKISKLKKEFKLKWTLIDFEELKFEYSNFSNKALFFSNGNIPSVHHYYYYSQLPKNTTLYEGYGGSEFVKGELSNGMYTQLLYNVIVNKDKIEKALKEIFKDIPDTSLKKIMSYYYDNYSEYFIPISTQNGNNKFIEYLFKTLPSKIFGGIFSLNQFFDFQLFEPYFSPHILSSFFSNGMGVVHNNSLSPNFLGSVKSLKPQSLVIKNLNKKIYHSLLDRNVKYSEWNEPYYINYLKRNTRILQDKMLLKKYPMRSQVDFKSIKEPIKSRSLYLQELFPNFDFGDFTSSYVTFYKTIKGFTTDKKINI